MQNIVSFIGLFCKRDLESTNRSLSQVALYSMHSCQEMIDNKPGCFEWFGLDFMVDEDYNVWNLECNIKCVCVCVCVCARALTPKP